MALELTVGDREALRRILAELIGESGADSCVVCDQAGHVVVDKNLEQHDPSLISALGAGVFAATGELARILGEDEFSMVFHQGETRSIVIGSAGEDILLIVLFPGSTGMDGVKQHAGVAAEAIGRIIVGSGGRRVEQDSQVHAFVEQGEP